MKEKPIIKDLTILCVDTRNYAQAVNALNKCLEQVTPERCVFLTDLDVKVDGFEVVKIPPIHTKRDYSRFIVKELYKYFDTSHCLVVQWDGYILNGDMWNDEFMKADYIGASWIYDSDRQVGNGGFSIRSRKLQQILGEDEMIQVVHPEDQSICIIYKYYLEEKYGIEFADENLADTFSFELRTPICKTFGFHGFFHKPFQETIIITRTGAMGDVIALEPVLHYYFKKGYRVVLNTLPQFLNLFSQHYFKVHTTGELDNRLVCKEINLDMAYEVKPKQLHLQSYYDMCGISDGEIRNPKLTLNFDPKENPLFTKYVVIHNDIRPQASRNIEGVNWQMVVSYLNENGYKVFQIGVGEHELIEGAIFMSTPNQLMLLWLIGGSDMFIGIDSGPANVAVAMNVPVIACYGSVNPEYLIPDLSNVYAIHNHHGKGVCDKRFCWHEAVTTCGVECYIDNLKPPCSQFKTVDILIAIDSIIKKQNIL